MSSHSVAQPRDVQPPAPATVQAVLNRLADAIDPEALGSRSAAWRSGRSQSSRAGDTVSCPWHGSRFDLRTGAVAEGPAVFTQPRLQTRERDGKIDVGFPNDPGAELPELNTFDGTWHGAESAG